MKYANLTLRKVALVLEDDGHVQMAEFVRWMDDNYKRTQFMYESTSGSLKRVLERLHKYEPPVKAEYLSYRSPPESDG